MAVDEAKLNEFVGKAVSEWGAAYGVLLTFLGDRLGLFKAMAGAGELTPEELAKKTGTHPRMIREWLTAQAVGGFVTYNPFAGTYILPDEQAFALTNENSPRLYSRRISNHNGTFQRRRKNHRSISNWKRSWMGRPSSLPI